MKVTAQITILFFILLLFTACEVETPMPQNSTSITVLLDEARANLRDPAVALPLLDRAIGEARANSLLPLEQQALNLKGYVLKSEESTKEEALKAFGMAASLDASKEQTAYAQYHLGFVLYHLRQYSLAIPYLADALTYYSDHGESLWEGRANYLLSICYLNAVEQDINKAKRHSLEALAIAHTLDDAKLYRQVLGIRLEIELRTENITNAIPIADELQRLSTSASVSSLIYFKVMYGFYTATKKGEDDAKQLFMEALALSKSHELAYFTRVNYSEYLYSIGEVKSAIALLQAAINEGPDYEGYQESVADCHRLLATWYEEAGAFEKAASHWGQYSEHLRLHAAQTASAGAKYEQERLRQMLASFAQNPEQHSSMQKYMPFMGLALASVLVGLGFQERRRMRLHRELAATRQALAATEASQQEAYDKARFAYDSLKATGMLKHVQLNPPGEKGKLPEG